MGARNSALIALAVGALALGTGCQTTGNKTESKKPDVTQPGVLPPPQETTRSGSEAGANATGATGPVVPASATTPATTASVGPAPFAVPPAGRANDPSLSKLTSKMERKVVATDFAVGWQPRVAYLPDPVKNGRMSPGIAGQMFLFGGQKLEFAQADGVLTVDLVDDSPRPAGQPSATPERWQFDKNTLRNLQTRDETFGKSYALFLPWPAYKSDVTRVKISARYDPESGPPLFATPSTITLDNTPFGSPVWSDAKDRANSAPPFSARPIGTPATPPGAMTGPPIPLGGGAPMIPIHSAPAPAMPIPGAAAPIPIPNGPAPMIPLQNGPIPIRPEGSSVPAGFMPMAPMAPVGAGPVSAGPVGAVPGDVPQLAITLPGPK